MFARDIVSLSRKETEDFFFLMFFILSILFLFIVRKTKGKEKNVSSTMSFDQE